VVVSNAYAIKACSDLVPAPGPTVIGDSVVVEAGVLTSQVPVSQVSDVTDSQRAILATLDQSTLDAFAAQTALQIAQATGFSLAQATELKDALIAEIAVLNEQADSIALAGLDCYYHNTTQTANCALDSITPPSVVSAGAVVSRISQEAADANALAKAVAALRCVWVNDYQSAACDEGAEGDHILEYVNAGTLSSITSKADANALALALATSRLVCSYPNEQQVITCDADVDSVAADVVDSNPITIADHTIFSSTSVADANEQAVIAANLLLRCQWSSTLQPAVVCPEDEGHPASETVSPVYSVQPAAGAFISSISRADANEMAEAFSIAQLDCRYCNTEIPALCVIPEGSDDATADVPAGSFCELTYAAAQSLASALAAIPIKIKVSGTPTCHYTNDRQAAVCVQPDPNPDGYLYKFTTAAGVGISDESSGIIIVDAGSVTSVVSKADANAQAAALALSFLNCFFDSEENLGVSCPEDAAFGSYPTYSSPLVLTAGFFTSYTSLAEANILRDVYLASVTRCFWHNDARTAMCDSTEGQHVTTGTNLYLAITPDDAVIPAATLISLISKSDVNALAAALAIASLICNYANETQFGGDCAEGTIKLQSGEVAAGTVISGSKVSANSLALTLANALNVCVASSLFAGGTPGVQGPAGNCDTPCGAFYS